MRRFQLVIVFLCALLVSDSALAHKDEVALDIDDDGVVESAALETIATQNDINGVLTEPAPDEVLIDMSVPWTAVGSDGASNTIRLDDGVVSDQLFVDRDGDGVLDPGEGLAFPERHVVDLDDDGDIDHVDLQATIDSCGVTVNNSITGCKVILPRGRIDISETIRLGCDDTDDPGNRCTADANQRGIQIYGQGQGVITKGVDTDSYGGGTVLTWQGAPGGTMLAIFHSARFALADFALDIDGSAPGEAGEAIRLVGSGTKPTQGGTIDRIAITGAGGSGILSTSVAIMHTCQDGDCTTVGDGQFDKTAIRDVLIKSVGTCYFTEDQQNQLTELNRVDCTYDQTGIEIQGGDLAIRNSTIIEDDVDVNPGTQFAIRVGELTLGTTESASMVLVDGSHFEITEGFIESDTKTTGLTDGVLNLTNNRFNFKCTGAGDPLCSQIFLDVHANFMIQVEGNYFRSNGAGNRVAIIDVDDGSWDGVGGIHWGTNTRRERAGSVLSFDVSPTSANKSKIDVDAAGIYNDLNFNFQRDAGE